MPRNKQKGNNSRLSQRGSRLADGPPQLQTGTVVRQWYRYRAYVGSTSLVPITVASVLNACGAVASATGASGVTMYGIAQAMRVLRYRAWCAAPVNVSQAADTFATVSVDFDVQSSSITAGGMQFTDTTMSSAKLAHLDVVPPRQSFAAQWHNRSEGGSTLFILNNALSSIVDIEVEWILMDDDSNANVTSIGSTVAGHVYYPPLDGASAVYIAIGRQSA